MLQAPPSTLRGRFGRVLDLIGEQVIEPPRRAGRAFQEAAKMVTHPFRGPLGAGDGRRIRPGAAVLLDDDRPETRCKLLACPGGGGFHAWAADQEKHRREQSDNAQHDGLHTAAATTPGACSCIGSGSNALAYCTL